MPVATAAAPAFAMRLRAKSDEDRLGILQQVHPDYAAYKSSWELLLDAFEGRGGFLTGGYLWPYPREAQEEFDKRKVMARYHNYLETLVDLYVRFMFTSGVRRDSRSEEYNAWLENVDGAGTPINDFLKKLASVALVSGHAGVLIDKTPDEAVGPRKVDEQAKVIATVFTAPAIADWRHDGNALVSVKLIEAAPAKDIAEPLLTGDDAKQYLMWDKEGWARFDARGILVDGNITGLNLVPLIILRPKPSQTSPMIGRPLVSNANVIQALFNRASEEDQVLRDQAFSVLTVSVGPEGDVDQAKAQLGNVVGSAKALVVKGQIDYKTPSQEVPVTLRENIAFLVQEIYRSAHVRYSRDSLAAESGESIRLQYTELNEMLQGFAKALAQCERELARVYFAWTAATPELAQAEFEAAEVEATYPEDFFLDDLMADLEAWAEGIRMNLGKTMTDRIKKKAVRRIDPEIPADELKKIDGEIEAQAEELPMVAPFGGPGAVETADAEGAGIRRVTGQTPPPAADEDEDEG